MCLELESGGESNLALSAADVKLMELCQVPPACERASIFARQGIRTIPGEEMSDNLLCCSVVVHVQLESTSWTKERMP